MSAVENPVLIHCPGLVSTESAILNGTVMLNGIALLKVIALSTAAAKGMNLTQEWSQSRMRSGTAFYLDHEAIYKADQLECCSRGMD